MQTKFPIVLASDNNQVSAMATVMTSVILNAESDVYLDFFCLLSDDVSEKNIELLKKCENICGNCLVNIVQPDSFFDVNYHKMTSLSYSISKPTLYRLKIPSLLKAYDKAIYLDTDVIVREDLKALYNFPIKENFIAGVPAAWAQIIKGNRNKWHKKSSIPSMDNYVNSGVLLMNLKELRAHCIEETWLALLKNKKIMNLDADQLVLNLSCYHKIDFLPFKYNVTMSNLKYINKLDVLFSKKEIRESIENPAIFHWTGAKKPWKYYDIFLAHEWWHYYRQSPFCDVALNRVSKSFFSF